MTAPDDLAAVARQLGREPRGVHSIAHRCACGLPDVVRTLPELPDGSPFPTTYYATCPRLASSIGGLEGDGVMREMTARLEASDELQEKYAAAHDDYLGRRRELGEVAVIAGISAGGMPTRIKCLHALVAHSLAVGPGINPFGDEALELLDPWWEPRSCADDQRDEGVGTDESRDGERP